MKNESQIKVFLVIVLLILMVVGTFILREYNLDYSFYGYIPENAVAQIKWEQERASRSPDQYTPQGTILLITESGDSIRDAFYSLDGSWWGANLVIYKGNHPATIGRKVYVKGTFNKQNIYYIEAADLKDLHE